jgi:DNA-binding response OmpR family regulator
VSDDRVPLLLVDDDPANLLTLSALLEEEGFEVATARSTGEARTALGSGRGFSAAIVDRNLDGEDGVALAAELRAAGSAGAVLILSGDPEDPDLLEGIDGWLLKGTPVDELVGRIRASIEERAPG